MSPIFMDLQYNNNLSLYHTVRRHKKTALDCVVKENQSKLDNHELHQYPDSLSFHDSSRHHLYPLTYAPKHKQSFDFLTFSKREPPLLHSVHHNDNTQPASPHLHNLRTHSHLYLQGSVFFFKELHDHERLPP
ncbi:hypothetical protein Q8A73_008518 [Channa argus]|nr:hypothetical protein Q8A73_008518 [Channa argus]